MMSQDDATVLDILKAARLAIEFKGELDKSAFLDDLKTQSAILHQLMILGEAVKRLSDTLRATHPQIPWRMIAGMRDQLIHGYDDVDLDEVWETIHRDLPRLIGQLESFTSHEEHDEELRRAQTDENSPSAEDDLS